MKKLLANSNGMTLVEVVIATMIVALIALAVLTAIVQGAFLIGEADEIYTASILAQDHVDVLKKFNFDEISNSAEETDIEIDFDGDGDVDYFRTTTITENYNGFSDLIKVKVSVDMAEEGSPEGHPVIMETIFVDE